MKEGGLQRRGFYPGNCQRKAAAIGRRKETLIIIEEGSTS